MLRSKVDHDPYDDAGHIKEQREAIRVSYH